MKRLLLALAFVLFASPCFAACPSPLAVTTQSGIQTNFGVSADSGGNCSSNLTQSALASGSSTPLIVCTSVVSYSNSLSGINQLVALSSGNKIKICGLEITMGNTATTVGFAYGTGSNCGTGTGYQGLPFSDRSSSSFAGALLPAGANIVIPGPYWSGYATLASNALCLQTSAGNAMTVAVHYDVSP